MKVILCLWTGKINIVKMSILLLKGKPQAKMASLELKVMMTNLDLIS